MKVMQDNGHVIRAAMEGVGYDLMMGADLFRAEGAMPEQCNLIGGGAHSRLWGQDVYKRQVWADTGSGVCVYISYI